MNVLVMGIGNLLLQDEGAGVRVVEEFGRRFLPIPGVHVLDGGTSGIELLSYLSGRDALILLDVVKGGLPAGAVSRYEGEEVPALFQQKISPHQLGISDLLATARLMGELPAKVVLLGIEPQSIGTGLELTREVARSVTTVAEQVAAELWQMGVPVLPRPA
ncbi:HyaD/HybD family hydrogenase maturation endopeptidase [Geomonas sp. Red32]|uniref:HyaD/HybD family hydrogenase maturation endopeptidase n=1 Tax=Geomonas sp. Red32 TaxID=2912856 RepID=UPI00202CF3AA|nr:HyaD/HybD family hydrogenase maturation endopeptidase [Geomonas sp. Red32]MCM0082125.1 HyaD/HybD family hydrogenase maturation endopeptidase [Geomonas sp. Red32]